jgi:hypothetical protein
MARYGFSGFVYSMAHGWGPKPLENLQSFGGTNGDGTLIYPAELMGGVGPMPSIRLMLLRDVIEDVALGRVKTPVMAPRAAVDLPFQFTIRRPDVPDTTGSARLDAKKTTLIVHFRAPKPQTGDYLAVEIAPTNIEKTPEKWRFVATRLKNLRVQKWTREGRFELEKSGFVANIREENGVMLAEMRIPLSIADYGPQFRFDALRRTTVGGAKITTYAFSGTGDPASMAEVLN